MAVSKRLRHEIFRRDNHTCQSCGAKAPDVKLEPDHVIPVALGGSDEPSNLQTLCEDCNGGKSATPPDAATVAKVADDAARWSRAMQAAGDQMLESREVRDKARAAFDARWKSWNEGRTPVPRPSGWEVSVDNFIKAGLPLPVLLDCIDIAMSARQVKADGVFKYACGAAWKEVRRLQAAASASLNGTSEPAPAVEDLEDVEEFRRGRYDAAHDLLCNLSDEDQERYRDEVRRWGDEESVDDPIEMEVDAAQYAFTDATYERDRLFNAIHDLLGILPVESVNEWREQALDEIRMNMGDDFREYDVLVHTVRVAKEEYEFNDARTYLASLPAEEAAEWIACATTFLGHDENPAHRMRIDVQAAEYARKNKAEHTVLRGLCGGPGEHGAKCPQRGAYLMRLDECAGCGEKCTAHMVCVRHLEMLIDGKVTSRSTGKTLVVVDFKEIEPVREEESPF